MSLGRETANGPKTQVVRRFRRVSGHATPFFPYGLLPLLGLALLTLIAWTSFAPHSVEDEVRSAADRAVADSGADWASVDVSGQWVKVTGAPPTPAAGQRVLDAVRTSRAPTWLGLARPATRVTGDFSARGARPDPAGASAPGTLSDAANDEPEFLFRLTGGKLTLNGRVPDIATRNALVAAARKSLPGWIETVESNLEVIGVPPPDGFQETMMRGVETLTLCDAGTASFTSRLFSLRCELPERDAERVRKLASATLPYGSVGEVEILAKEIVDSCEGELARLLEAARIEFDPGSDRIAASKAALLDLTARAASDCPGTLRVEGHTDNTGSTELNLSLSRRRAEAVRAALIQRGVSPARIVAAGYGPSRPIGNNAVDEGRAQNRRIEIRIVGTDE
jgi:outer membrane protein OmpA-like peptidoglycan-associated protein